jgi:hypothetical protein
MTTHIPTDRTALEVEEEGREGVTVTPEMVEAGAEVIWRELGDIIPYRNSFGRDLALWVFQAMSRAVHP